MSGNMLRQEAHAVQQQDSPRQPTRAHRAAMADAPRCDGRCSVLRSHMQRTAFFREKFL